MKKSHPIIIVKKRKSPKTAHHGGTWKIAYADFMTAMMAFFLVMWLLSSSSPEERKQVADYFKMPLHTALAQGNRFTISDNIIPGGGSDIIKQEGEVTKYSRSQERTRDRQRLRKTQQRLEQMIRSDPRLRQLQPNLNIKMLDEGLRIQIVDSKNRPMFLTGSKQVAPYMRDILRLIAPVLNDVPNLISLSGHTDSKKYANGERSYSNWELSADRANASRRELSEGGLHIGKILRVMGMGDVVKMPGTAESDNISQRRISIVVLTREAEQKILSLQEADQATLSEDMPETVRDRLEDTLNIPEPKTVGLPAAGSAASTLSTPAAQSTSAPVVIPTVPLTAASGLIPVPGAAPTAQLAPSPDAYRVISSLPVPGQLVALPGLPAAAEGIVDEHATHLTPSPPTNAGIMPGEGIDLVIGADESAPVTNPSSPQG